MTHCWGLCGSSSFRTTPPPTWSQRGTKQTWSKRRSRFVWSRMQKWTWTCPTWTCSSGWRLSGSDWAWIRTGGKLQKVRLRLFFCTKDSFGLDCSRRLEAGGSRRLGTKNTKRCKKTETGRSGRSLAGTVSLRLLRLLCSSLPHRCCFSAHTIWPLTLPHITTHALLCTSAASFSSSCFLPSFDLCLLFWGLFTLIPVVLRSLFHGFSSLHCFN